MRLPHLSRLPPRRPPHTICSICRTNILRTTCSRRSTSSSLQKLLQPTMALVSLQSSPNILNISSSSSSLSTRRCPRNQFTTSQPPSRHHHLSLHLTCSMLRFPPELIPKVVCLLAYSNKRCSIKQLGWWRGLRSWVGSNVRWPWGAQIDSGALQMNLLVKIEKRLLCLFRQSTCQIFASSTMTKTIPQRQKLRNRTRPTWIINTTIANSWTRICIRPRRVRSGDQRTTTILICMVKSKIFFNTPIWMCLMTKRTTRTRQSASFSACSQTPVKVVMLTSPKIS